jgi:hypothetical protein
LLLLSTVAKSLTCFAQRDEVVPKEMYKNDDGGCLPSHSSLQAHREGLGRGGHAAHIVGLVAFGSGDRCKLAGGHDVLDITPSKERHA